MTLELGSSFKTGWVQKGLYSAALECVFDGVSFSSSSERNGSDVKGLSIVLQDVKCPLFCDLWGFAVVAIETK